jgi:hypothetical protein
MCVHMREKAQTATDSLAPCEEDDTCVHMRRRRRRIHVCHMRRMIRVFI